MQLTESAQLFKDRLEEQGFTAEVVELPDDARTAQAAADALGCEVAEIAKSIIFKLEESGEPLLVVASGSNRINEKKLGALLNDKLGKADAAFVREWTGYAIGGVPPMAHKEKLRTFIDEDLFQYKAIWAAAGHPKAVFKLTADQLVQMTQGEVIAVH